MSQSVRTHSRRPGLLYIGRVYWILLAACSSWLVILVAGEALKWAALAAAGLI